MFRSCGNGAAHATPAISGTAAGRVEPAWTLVIEPERRGLPVNWQELWAYRELLYFFVWRDVRVRYRHTVLGAAWAVLQPLAIMAVFSLFLGRFAQVPSAGLPYPLFVFAGVLPWMFFANALSSASQSIVDSQQLVTKVYFPRLIIPTAAVGAALVDFAIGFGVLLGFMLFHGVLPGWGFLAAPLLALGLVLGALGVGTLLSALTAAYRDFRYMVPFMVQIWMLATPSVYMDAHSVVNARSTGLLALNPAYGLIANFRAAVLKGEFDFYALGVSSASALLLMLVGCFYFRRVERNFADVI